jgi:hypothetical protein
VLGSIAYVAERWLAGGVCYFLGGVLAVSKIVESISVFLEMHSLIVILVPCTV